MVRAIPAEPTASAGRYPTRRPLSFVFLELTHHCNHRCRHCYACSAPKTAPRSLPTSRWTSLLDEIAGAGADRVQLTGGEPLTHPDLFPLIEHARYLGLSVEIFTNASLLRAEAMDRIASLGVDVAISLHSHLPEVHDAITCVPGSHAAALAAIRGLVERQVELRVAAVLLSENADHGDAVAGLMRDMGVLAPVKTDEVRPTGRGERAGTPSSEPSRCGGSLGAFGLLHAGPDTPPTCWDGKLAISPEGAVMPCIFARDLVVGTVTTTPLEAVLESRKLLEVWSLTTDDVPECAGCDRKKSCFDCRALPLSVHGDLWAKSPRCNYQPHSRPRATSDESVFGKAPGLAEALLDDERFLLDPRTARLHRLDPIAALVFDALGAGWDRQSVKLDLANAFDIPLSVSEGDVDSLIDEMVFAGIIEPVRLAEGGESPVNPCREEPPSAEDVDERHGLERCAPKAEEDPGFEPASGTSRPPKQDRRHGNEEQLHSAPIDCAGIPFDLRASKEVLDEISVHFAQIILDSPEPTACETLAIHSRSPGPAYASHHLFRGERWIGMARDMGSLFSLLETTLCSIATETPRRADAEDSSLCLHACALAGARGAVVMPAAHGVGKSTLSAWASIAGLTYLGDEVARIRRPPETEPFVIGLPKPIKLKPKGLKSLPRELGSRVHSGSYGQGWLSIPGALGAHPIRAFVFLRREGGSPTLLALDPKDAVEELLSQSFNIQALGPPAALEEACALAAAIPSFLLDLTDSEGATDALRSLVF